MKKIISKILSFLIFVLLWIVGKIIFQIINKVKIIGKENLPKDKGKGILYLSNHQTLIDSLLVGIAVINLKEIIFKQKNIPISAPDKKNFFESKKSCFIMKLTNSVPVSRKPLRKEDIKKQINLFVSVLKKNNLYIFFEGSRTRTGKINNCKYGVAKTILEAHPRHVVPITIININQIMPIEVGFCYKKIKRGKEGYLIIGENIDFSDIYNQEMLEIQKIEQIKARIREKISENFF